MDFLLSEEQQKNQAEYEHFAAEYIAPQARLMDESEAFPRELVKKIMSTGYMGIPFGKAYGGSGQDYLSYILCIEEFSKKCATIGTIVSASTSLCADVIAKYGSEEQKKKYLTQLASGQKLGAFALTEPGAGTDAGGIRTTATNHGDYYLLNGSKVLITNGNEADIYVIAASTDSEKGARGISLFIVEKDTNGFEFGQKEKMMGIRASSTYDLFFKACKVPAQNLLGEEGRGYGMAMDGLNGGRIGIAAQSLGIAEGALAATIEYTSQRCQFGQQISSFQNTQFQLAEMSTKIEAARYLVYRAAIAKENGEEYGVHAARAKLFASRVAVEITEDAVQLHGGYGYCRAYEVERMMRDAKITEIYEGTSEVQRMVIAGDLLPRTPKAKVVDQLQTDSLEGELSGIIQLEENQKLILNATKNKIRQVQEHGGTIIVGVGRGLATLEGVELADAFARQIKGTLVATRPVVNQGLLENSYMVGQTGRSITADLYIALGISGNLQHMCGVHAQSMIAVNNDDNAPIVKNASCAVIGDAKRFLDLF